MHGLLLPDDAAAQRRLHLQQLLALARRDARDRDARPERDDLGHVLARHGARRAGIGLLPAAALHAQLRTQLLFTFPQGGRTRKVLCTHGVFHLRRCGGELRLERVHPLGLHQCLHPHT